MQRVTWSQQGLMPETSKGTENEEGNVGREQPHSTSQRLTPTVRLVIQDYEHSPAFLIALISVLSLPDTTSM